MAKGPRNISLAALMHYRFPLSAIASILHRISGVILFLMIPFTLWVLHLSLSSQAEFLLVKDYMGSPLVAFLMWVLLSALWYHLVAGLKHLLMDLGFCEEKASGQMASVTVMVLGALGAIGIGVWIIC
jgi:succinate dehydrogenase / fumarate reductase cytochrome b subunit